MDQMAEKCHAPNSGKLIVLIGNVLRFFCAVLL